MKVLDPFRARAPRAVAAVEARFVLLRKAFSFAVIGLLNTAVDATVFFLAYTHLTASPQALDFISGLAEGCGCASPDSMRLIISNVLAWLVAVSGSYAMNSFITFAAESGGKLGWRAYGTFVVSSVLGVIANTATLVIAAQVLPVWAAKVCAILVSFVVNFSMSHFVVFRRRPDAAASGP